MRTESLGTSYLGLPDGPAPYPGVVVIHEASGLNDNVRDICRRFAAEGYAALGVDLFEGRNRTACMARMFIGGMAGNLSYYGVPALKAALGRVAGHPEVDANRIGAIGFCLGGSIVLTWACTDGRLGAIAPFYGAAPKPREAIRRLCPVVGSWPGKDFTTKAAGVLEADLTAAGIPHDLKVYPGAKHSFFNDQWRNYHAAAAADSWQRVLAFFAEHVRGGLLSRPHAACLPLDGQDRLRAYALSADVPHVAAGLLLKLDDQGLTCPAADRSMRAAIASEDPRTVGASARIITHTLTNGGHLAAAIATASSQAARLGRDVAVLPDAVDGFAQRRQPIAPRLRSWPGQGRRSPGW